VIRGLAEDIVSAFEQGRVKHSCPVESFSASTSITWRRSVRRAARLPRSRRGGAGSAERGGADGITVHLREDRRHIQTTTVQRLRATVAKLKPRDGGGLRRCATRRWRFDQRTSVSCPSARRAHHEGGLDVAAQLSRAPPAGARLREAKIRVSLFITPIRARSNAAAETGAEVVELHTGAYSEAHGPYG